MLTILEPVENELIITKSSFITYLYPVQTVDEAKNYIKQIKEKHPTATHHVVCYIIGKTGENGTANDDGEPSGTAGLPALNVFKNNDITNFVCIIVRYFGGIKLGAGGLVRAYSKSASEALKLAIKVPIIEYDYLELEFNYAYLDIIENRLKNYEITNRSFSTNITLIVKVNKLETNSLISMLVGLTNNQIKIKVVIKSDE